VAEKERKARKEKERNLFWGKKNKEKRRVP
jgi:hypothetical protein